MVNEIDDALDEDSDDDNEFGTLVWAVSITNLFDVWGKELSHKLSSYPFNKNNINFLSKR